MRLGVLTGKFPDDPSRFRAVGVMQRRMLDFNDDMLGRTRPLIDELSAVAHAYGVSVGQVTLT